MIEWINLKKETKTIKNEAIFNELKKYSRELEKKKEIVVFNKIDLINKDEINYKLTKFKKRIKKNVLLISTLDKTSLSEIKSKLIKHVS